MESDGRNMDTIQDHHEIRVNDEPRGGGEEVQMEPVDPAPNPPEDRVVPITPLSQLLREIRSFVGQQECQSLVPGIQ